MAHQTSAAGEGNQCQFLWVERILRSAEKFDIVIDNAHVNEAELGAYYRQKGSYPLQPLAPGLAGAVQRGQ